MLYLCLLCSTTHVDFLTMICVCVCVWVCEPLLEVYSRAAWKQARDESARESSIDIWTAKAESGFTLARDSRSVERTKKLPWNVWMDKPEDKQKKRKCEKCANKQVTKQTSVLHLQLLNLKASFSFFLVFCLLWLNPATQSSCVCVWVLWSSYL